MSIVVERYTEIKSNIVSLKPIKPVNIIAVSKTFPLEHILPLIKHGNILESKLNGLGMKISI